MSGVCCARFFSPLTPAKAGSGTKRESFRVALDSRLRGNERSLLRAFLFSAHPRGSGGPGTHKSPRILPWVPAFAGTSGGRAPTFQATAPDHHATPSFFCRLVDEVVYWNTSFFSG